MDNETLARLANIATVKNHIVTNILSVGRGVIPQKRLHKLNAFAKDLDVLFVNTVIEEMEQSGIKTEEEDLALIQQRIAEEKEKKANANNQDK